MPDAAKSGGTAGSHRNSMHGQLAMLRDKHRCQILDAHTRPSRDDNNIRVSQQGLQDGFVIVANQAREVDKTSVTLYERREHRPVGIDNMKAMRMGSGGQQFVTGYDQSYTRPADHVHLSLTDGTQDAQILRA